MSGNLQFGLGQRVAVHDDESVASLLARTAEANDFPTIEALFSEMGSERTRAFRLLRYSDDEIRDFSELLGIDQERFRRTSFAYGPDFETRLVNGTAVRGRLLERIRRRFSPSSLARSPYIRSAWHIRLFPFCEESWEMLRDDCDDCGAKQGWYHTVGIDRCDVCMNDLTRVTTSLVPDDDREPLSRAVGLLSHDPARLSKSLAEIPIAQIDATTAVELMFRLVPVVDSSIPLSRNFWRLDIEQPRLAKAVAEAWRLLREWPDAPRRLFGQRLANSSQRHTDGNHGRTSWFLSCNRRFQTYDPVKRIIFDLKQTCSFRLGENMEFDGRRLMSPLQTERRLVRDGAEVARIRRAGRLNSVFSIRSERACPLYFEDEVVALKPRLDDRLKMSAAAFALGLPNYAIPILVLDGLLEPLDAAFLRKGDGVGIVTKSSVERLLGQLENKAASEVTDAQSMAVATRAIGGGLKPWGEIVRQLLDGAIPFVRPDGRHGISRLIVPKACMSQLARLTAISQPSSTLPSGLSIRDAGEVLNLNSRSSTEVFRQKRNGMAPTNFSTVPLRTALQLARDRMHTSELTARLRISTRKAMAQATAAGLKKCDLCGYHREEAESFLRQGQSYR